MPKRSLSCCGCRRSARRPEPVGADELRSLTARSSTCSATPCGNAGGNGRGPNRRPGARGKCADDYEGRAALRGTGRGAGADRALLTTRGSSVFPRRKPASFRESRVLLEDQQAAPAHVSRGKRHGHRQELVLNAEFGNLRSLMKFLLIVIGGWPWCTRSRFSVVLITVNKRPDLLWVSALTILPLPVIFPLVRRIQTWATPGARGAAGQSGGGELSGAGRYRSISRMFSASCRRRPRAFPGISCRRRPPPGKPLRVVPKSGTSSLSSRR